MLRETRALANTRNQCAAVNFVTGSNETIGAACSNSTDSFKAEWATTTESEDGGHSGHSESASATPSESAAAAATTAAEGSGAIATAGMGAFVGGMGALAAALML
jgi:hypothetical protein